MKLVPNLSQKRVYMSYPTDTLYSGVAESAYSILAENVDITPNLLEIWEEYVKSTQTLGSVYPPVLCASIQKYIPYPTCP